MSIKRRIEKIEKELAIEDNTQWLRLHDPENPEQFIELKGCRTLADFVVMAFKAENKPAEGN